MLVDGVPYRYGRSGKRYYLEAYAYTGDQSLIEVVRRFVGQRDAAASRRGKGLER